MIFSIVLALAFFNARSDFQSQKNMLQKMVNKLKPELTACYQEFLNREPKGLIQGPVVLHLSVEKRESRISVINKFTSDQKFEGCLMRTFEKSVTFRQISNRFAVEIPLFFRALEAGMAYR